jgi:hypothetical protein
MAGGWELYVFTVIAVAGDCRADRSAISRLHEQGAFGRGYQSVIQGLTDCAHIRMYVIVQFVLVHHESRESKTERISRTVYRTLRNLKVLLGKNFKRPEQAFRTRPAILLEDNGSLHGEGNV